MLVENTLRLLGFTLGTGLHLFLAVVLARKRGAQQVERLLLAVIVSSGFWHAANALAFFHRINTGLQTSPFLNFADQTALLGLALTPALLFHLCLAWTGRNPWIATFGYAVVLATWWLRSTGRMDGDRWVLAASLVFVALLCLSAASRSHERLYRRFFRNPLQFAARQPERITPAGARQLQRRFTADEQRRNRIAELIAHLPMYQLHDVALQQIHPTLDL